jgi:hypothetical protein
MKPVAIRTWAIAQPLLADQLIDSRALEPIELSGIGSTDVHLFGKSVQFRKHVVGCDAVYQIRIGGVAAHILHIQAAAHSFSPLALAPVVYRRLERKRRTALRYGVQPIWLVTR